MLKIKRNDKCPCRSGKKYKKCCLINPDKNAEITRAVSIAKTYEEVSQIIAKPKKIYQLKVDLVRMGFYKIEEEISRIFEIEGSQTLYDFHLIIQNAFDWDNDHMFSFYLGNELFDRENEYSGTPIGEHTVPRFGKPNKSATKAQLRDLDLSEDFSFWYLFDYGDELVHKVSVIKIRKMMPEETGFPKILNKIGMAPPQYGKMEIE